MNLYYRISTLSTLFLLFIFSFNVAHAGPEDHEILRGVAADKKVQGAELVRISYDREVPSYIRFRDGNGFPVEDLELWLRKVFELGQEFGLKRINVHEDRLGFTHFRYRQTVNGIPVDGGYYIAHVKGGMVRSINGTIYSGLEVPSSPSLSKDRAREMAISNVGAETYKWEIPGEEEFLKEQRNDPNATYYPEGELMVAPREGAYKKENMRLAFKFDIYAHKPLYRGDVFVDASSGEVIFKELKIHIIDDTGTAVTGYSGTRTIVTDSTGPSSYRLRETGRGNGVETYDMNEGTSYNNAVDFADNDNYWDNANAELDEYAGDAHWGAEMTYDYFWQKHNRNSIDDNGYKLRSYVHYDVDYGNAFWDGSKMTYGDGSSGNSPLTSLDICGHEVTHGLTTNTADLVYQDEPGALNESFSDIFGESIEYFAKPGNFSWVVGEDIGGIRDMSDPNSYNDPDTYQGPNWYTGTNDNGGVHTNSGVQNYWYYLMVEGGSGTNGVGDSYNVTGVGFDTAGAIAFRNLTVYLGTNSQYSDARFYAIQSAIDLYGACSQPHQSTVNAWYAVNVGGPYSPSVASDFSVPKDSSCQTPFTVDFNNMSQNASNYKWYFGDGDSSTAIAPSHTYQDTGDYTVTLQVSGGCGADTTVKTDFISIDTAYPCVVSMPVSGWGNKRTSCTGTLYDSGGPSSNYPNDEDSYITIEPTGASQVILNFKSFDIEAGSGSTCDYDFLEIFDGQDQTAPSLGKYCNTNGSPGVVTSSGGAITLHLHSDAYVNEPGFEVEWSCSYPSNPPSTDFKVSDTSDCDGMVNFTDLSTNNPTSWYWDFGDGNTSTNQDPTHTYTNAGVYTVKLVTSNSNGSDSLTRVDLIHTNMPEDPVGASDTVCKGEVADLSATTGNGDLRWYDTSTGGTPIDSGSTYTTDTLNTSTDFWVESVVTNPVQNVGAQDNSIGSGDYFNYDQHLVFDCMAPMTLISVKVYANGAMNRTIELRNSAGTVLQDTTIYIPDGQQRVTLDFDVPVQNDLQLGVDGQGAELYRNDSGPNYPYEIPGLVSITESSASSPQDYYYFFYDWEVREEGCQSSRVMVTASVQQGYEPTITNAPDTVCRSEDPITMSADTSGGTWNGSGVTGNSFDPGSAGTGVHEVTYSFTDDYGCERTDTTQIVVESCGTTSLRENEEEGRISVSPNPNDGSFYITGVPRSRGTTVLITDVYGKLVERIDAEDLDPSSSRMKIQLDENAKGVYFIRVVGDQEQQVQRILVQ